MDDGRGSRVESEESFGDLKRNPNASGEAGRVRVCVEEVVERAIRHELDNQKPQL